MPRHGDPRHTALLATKQFRSALFLLPRWKKNKFLTLIDRRIGMRLRMQPQPLDMMQYRLAEMIGIAIQQARKYGSSTNRVGVGRLQRIVLALHVTPALFSDEVPEAISRRPKSADPHQGVCFFAAGRPPFHKPLAKLVALRPAA